MAEKELRVPGEIWKQAVAAGLAEYRKRPGVVPMNKIPKLLLEEKLTRDVEAVLHAALPVLLQAQARTGYWEIVNGDGDRRWALVEETDGTRRADGDV